MSSHNLQIAHRPANSAGVDGVRWQAVLAHDLRFDGQFVYAVRSTGVYCRPSCPSRRPHPKQVAFYPTPDTAERAGFRACRRCHPRMFEELLEKRRMEEELRLAAAIQARLRPLAWPMREGWELTGTSSSCREIGGDYYDCFDHPQDGSLILALGDVAGKGADAALLMSSLHAAVRAQSRLGASVAEVMREINHYLYATTPAEKFVTLFYAELEPSAGILHYSNAGHPPPLLLHGEEVTRLEAGGVPLGLFPNPSYAQGNAVLEPGDVLLLFSDGVSETRDEKEEGFGFRRLVQAARQEPESSASALRERIEEALARFAGAAPPADDRTLMVVKRTANERQERERVLASRDRLALSRLPEVGFGSQGGNGLEVSVHGD